MRAPASGLLAPNSSRRAMRPGISFSARRIWCRPASARDRSATLNGSAVVDSATVEMAIAPFSHPSTWSGADEREHLIADALHGRPVTAFDVESQERLGVRRSHREP